MPRGYYMTKKTRYIAGFLLYIKINYALFQGLSAPQQPLGFCCNVGAMVHASRGGLSWWVKKILQDAIPASPLQFTILKN